MQNLISFQICIQTSVIIEINYGEHFNRVSKRPKKCHNYCWIWRSFTGHEYLNRKISDLIESLFVSHNTPKSWLSAVSLDFKISIGFHIVSFLSICIALTNKRVVCLFDSTNPTTVFNFHSHALESKTLSSFVSLHEYTCMRNINDECGAIISDHKDEFCGNVSHQCKRLI